MCDYLTQTVTVHVTKQMLELNRRLKSVFLVSTVFHNVGRNVQADPEVLFTITPCFGIRKLSTTAAGAYL